MTQKKKALCLASMASNLDNFNRNNVKTLQSLGYDVTLASNFHTSEDINSQEKIDSFVKEMEADGVHIAQVDFSRKIGNIGGQIKSYKQVKELVNQGFDLIHCHAPICAAITRSCAKKYQKSGKSKVIYTAHGFHFYEGAPIKNWLLFYPIEKHYSRYTDVLTTINTEDYKRATEKFKAKKTIYVPGIGVDTAMFGASNKGHEIRKELGLSETDTMLLSVGELNENKNHKVVIKALAELKERGELPDNLHYIIAGIGDKEKELKKQVTESGLNAKVGLVGYRSDIADFYDAADAFLFPSFREGLSVSLMEAMASGLPVICSKIRGNTDLIDDGRGGLFFDSGDSGSARETIRELLNTNKEEMGIYNLQKIKGFDIKKVDETMKTYMGGGGIFRHLQEIASWNRIRSELSLPVDAFVLTSVGELNSNKNHSIIIKALKGCDDLQIHYLIVGKGALIQELQSLIGTLELESNVHLLGYRTDIADIYRASDVCVFPSIREGLGLAGIEGMSCGLPLIVSDNRGTRDFADKEGSIVCEYDDIKGFTEAILRLKNKPQKCREMGKHNKSISVKFDTAVVKCKMEKVYSDIDM